MRYILRVNMSDLSIKKEELPEKWNRYGGRVLTSAIVFKEVPPTADALGPGGRERFDFGHDFQFFRGVIPPYFNNLISKELKETANS